MGELIERAISWTRSQNNTVQPTLLTPTHWPTQPRSATEFLQLKLPIFSWTLVSLVLFRDFLPQSEHDKGKDMFNIIAFSAVIMQIEFICRNRETPFFEQKLLKVNGIKNRQLLINVANVLSDVCFKLIVDRKWWQSCGPNDTVLQYACM